MVCLPKIPITLLFIFFISCIKKIHKTAKPIDNNDSEIQFKIFANDTLKNTLKYTGFGYDIYLKDHLYIHQPGIPAISANKGFPTAADAQKTAKLVVYKIKNNILPPLVTIQELDSILNIPN